MRGRWILLTISIVMSIFALPACRQILQGLRDAEVRTVTLEPVKTAARRQNDWSNFGVCPIQLERRGMGSYVWTQFLAVLSASVSGVSGHEVRVVRGESCHLRYTDRFQSAVEFDLAALPPGEVTRAVLRMRSQADYGTDPPITPGTARCNVLTLGYATATWDRGVEGLELIPWAATGPGGFGAGAPIGPFNVTSTVKAWRSGERSNFGFVIAPDAAAVARNAEEITEENEQYMCNVTSGEYRLDVTVITPRR